MIVHLLALVLFALLAGCGAPRPERVVLISIDTLRADHVGCYGDARAHTPTLDALAAAGVRFDAAIAPTPLTLPSHTSLLTGLDPPRHGVRNNAAFRLPEGVPTLTERLRAAGFATAAFVGAVVLDRQYGLDRGFEVYDDRMSPRLASGDHGFTERTADRVVDAALAWLEQAPSRFFLWLHFYDPHANYQPPPGFQAAFPFDPYRGEIAFSDAELGRLLAAVRERHPDGRTLVVATSDHGESRGEHGEMTHAYTVYDSTQRIPLLMAGPGLPPGAVVGSVARLADVAPTLLRLLGAAPLDDTDGADLLPLARGARDATRVAHVETLATQLDFGWSPLLGLRSERFKYIRAPRPELYDLAQDPREIENLAAAQPERVAELDAVLAARLARGRPVERTLTLDAAERERLEQLGYVVADPPDAGVLGEVGGTDPKDGLPVIRALLEAMRLLHEGRPQDAFARIESLKAAGPTLELFRSDMAKEAGRPDLAEHHARAAITLSPSWSAGYRALGSALEAQGRLDAARSAYQEAARLDTAGAEPLVGLGRVAEARGELARAAELYREAAARRGASAEALWRLAALRLEAGAPDEVASLLAQVPPDVLAEPDPALRLAAAERRAGLPERARERLEAALRAAPHHAGLRQAYDALDGQGE